MPEYMAIRDNQVETKRGMLFKKAGERIMSKTLPNRHWVELRGDYSKMGLYEILTEMVSKLGYEDIPDSWGISDLQHILQENERKLREAKEGKSLKRQLKDRNIQFSEHISMRNLRILAKENFIEA